MWARSRTIAPRLLSALALIVLAAAGAVRATPLRQDPNVIVMRDNAFEPPNISVPAGTTITWQNKGRAPHSATSDAGLFDTGVITSQTEASVTLTTPGSYPYFCRIHGAAGGSGMAGTIVVVPQAQTTTTAIEAVTTAPGPSQVTATPILTTTAVPSPTLAVAPPISAPAPTATLLTAPGLLTRDQPVISNTIMIDQVAATQNGWLVIHKFDPNGQMLLTPIAGSTAITAGNTLSVSVTLDQSYSPGDRLMAMLHIDAGVVGTYEFPSGPDLPVKVGDQNVMMEFTVLANPAAGPAPATSLVVRDQPIVGSTVTVDQVVAGQPGWLAIYPLGPNGEPVANALAGFAAVPSGVSSAVQVPLSQAFNPGDRLAAMLHVDAGATGTFEYPVGLDLPAMANNLPVMGTFTILPGPVGDPAKLPNTGTSSSQAPIAMVALGLLLAGLGLTWSMSRRRNKV